MGRNYAEHIKELGNQNSAPSEAPMIFLKARAVICFVVAVLILMGDSCCFLSTFMSTGRSASSSC